MEMDELIDQVMQATWSLEEAAHLVHAVNPVTQPVKLSDRSKDPVARTFFWLKKEYEKDRLFSIAGDEQTPRFIPGTLMRHMEDKGRFISKVVRNMYDVAHGHPGLEGLGPWASTQRTFCKKNSLEPARIRALESVKGWVWDK